MVAQVRIVPDDSSKPTLTLAASVDPSQPRNNILNDSALSKKSDCNENYFVGSVILGRNNECKIQDSRVSRKHAKVMSYHVTSEDDEEKLEVKLEVVGKHPCWVNDVMIKPGGIKILKHGDKLSLLPGVVSYCIQHQVPKISLTEDDSVKNKFNHISDDVSQEPPTKIARRSPARTPEKDEIVKKKMEAVPETNNVASGSSPGKFDKKKCSSLMDYFKKSPQKNKQTSNGTSAEKEQSTDNSLNKSEWNIFSI